MLEPLCNVIQMVAGDLGVDMRTSYSGRYMYGKACMGLTGQMDDVMHVVAEVINVRYQELLSDCRDLGHEASDEELRASYEAEEQVARETTDLCRFRMDSMGTGSVIYWPNIQWEGDEPADQE